MLSKICLVALLATSAYCWPGMGKRSKKVAHGSDDGGDCFYTAWAHTDCDDPDIEHHNVPGRPANV